MVFSYPRGFQTPTTFYPPTGAEGALADSISHDFLSLVNGSAAVANVWTVDPGTAANSTAYGLTVTDYDGNALSSVSITSDGTATAAEIQAALVAAWNANSVLYGYAVATAGGSNTVVITARNAGVIYGISVAVTGGGSGYAATQTTAAANASVIPFGVVVGTPTAATGAAAGYCRVAGASTDTVRGISVRSESRIAYNDVDGIPPAEVVPVLTRGRVYVKPVTAFKPSDAVYYYHAGTNAGKVRAATDTNAVALATARFENAGSAGDIAILSINLP